MIDKRRMNCTTPNDHMMFIQFRIFKEDKAPVMEVPKARHTFSKIEQPEAAVEVQAQPQEQQQQFLVVEE